MELKEQLGKLGFSDTVALAVWEALDKEDNKVKATAVQSTFCIALSLISTGELKQRLVRALNCMAVTPSLRSPCQG